MASLQVPDRYVGGLAKFLKLSDEDAEKFFSALERTPVSKTPTVTLREAISSLGLSKSDVQSIAEAVTSLYAIWTHADKPASEVAAGVAKAVDESTFEDLQFGDDVKKNINPRLDRLFANSLFVVSIRADAERFEYDRVFSQASVSTDIRPIFGTSSEGSPEVAIITHMLNLHYLHDGRHMEFYIALDELDVESLIEVLESAASRAGNLKAVLAAAKLTHLTPE